MESLDLTNFGVVFSIFLVFTQRGIFRPSLVSHFFRYILLHPGVVIAIAASHSDL
jgi:hypothetical protein